MKMRSIFWLALGAFAQRIVGPINSDDPRWLSGNSGAPPETASLAFVFDTTGSMWDDLEKVQNGAQRILQSTRDRHIQPLYNYILVPFHDPEIGPVSRTRDPVEFQRELRNIRITGGGDCPEMSIYAIREALLLSLDNSYIYVFTDARAKDYSYLPEVLQIIQKKKSQVIFVLTGDCGDRDAEGYRAYEQIAAVSSGQVYQFTKQNLNQMVEYLESAIQAHKVHIVSSFQDSGEFKTWKIPFDSMLQEVTISITGHGRAVSVTDPNGRPYTRGQVVHIDNEETYVMVIHEPSPPGIWTISGSADRSFSFQVTGVSKLDFGVKFATSPTASYDESSYQPVQGIITHALIEPSEHIGDGIIEFVEIRDIKGVQLGSYHVSKINDRLFVAEPFRPPDVREYYLVVKGRTGSGEKFVRQSHNAIINIIPEPPKVKMLSSIPGYINGNVRIDCSVNSMMPHSITWWFGQSLDTKDWQALTLPKLYQPLEPVFYELVVSEGSEGFYKCQVETSRGGASGITFLDVEERPPIISGAEEVVAPPGGGATLHCNVTSKVPYKLIWKKRGHSSVASPYVKQAEDGLVISRLRPSDQGIYTCVASNIGGTTQHHIKLLVQQKPRIVITSLPEWQVDNHQGVTHRRILFKKDDRIRLLCQGDGHPRPFVFWTKNGENFRKIDRTVRVMGGRVQFYRAKESDAGVYVCEGRNSAGKVQERVFLEFMAPPRILRTFNSSSVEAGEDYTLFCEAEGDPTPTVRWLFNSQPIFGARFEQDGLNLIIRQISTELSGKFTCIAENNAGRDIHHMFVNVGEKPKISTDLQTVKPEIDLSVNLECAHTAIPAGKLSWFHNNRRIERSRNFEINDHGTLTIKTVTLEDEGNYRCTVVNTFGVADYRLNLVVTGLEAPTLTLQSSTVQHNVGDDVILTCFAEGKPLPEITWSHKGRTIPNSRQNQRNSELLIKNLALADKGVYKCHAKNEVGEDVGETTVDVVEPVSVTTVPEFKTPQEGETLELECNARGNPAPEISWFHNGKEVLPSNDLYITDTGLVILSTSRKMSGIWKCLAKNIANEIVIEHEITVEWPPSIIFPELPTSKSVKLGTQVVLECPVDASPEPVFEWTVNGNMVDFNSPGWLLNRETGTLIIEKASLALQDATFQCYATNIHGNSVISVGLKINIPPSIIPRTGPVVNAKVGSKVIIPCAASGIPDPELSWSSNDGKIEAQEGSNLVFDKVQLHHSGTYTCRATNSVGFDEFSVELIVQMAPLIFDPKWPEMAPVEGEMVILECPTQGAPKPRVTWYFNDIPASLIDNVVVEEDKIIIQKVDSTFGGAWRCEAENVVGIDVFDKKLFVESAPEVAGPANGTVVRDVVEFNDLDLFCNLVNVDEGTSITWLKEGERIDTTDGNRYELSFDKMKLKVKNIEIFDSGKYSCRAENRAGMSELELVVNVQQIPRIKGPKEVNIEPVANREITLICEVRGFPVPTVTWFYQNAPVNFNMFPGVYQMGTNLVIPVTSSSMTGDWSCKAESSVGDAIKTYNLDILLPPTIQTDKKQQVKEVVENSDVILDCIVDGEPKPSITWKLNGRLLDPYFSDLSEDKMKLYLKNSNSYDSGTYTCEVENRVGVDEISYNVTVLTAPKVHAVNPQQQATAGANVTLSCLSDGVPKPRLLWEKNGIVLTPDIGEKIKLGEDSLTINSLTREDLGTYTCTAVSDIGEDKGYITLNVRHRPTLKAEKKNYESTVHETVTLKCIAEGSPQPMIRWERNGTPVSGSARVRARNAYDSSTLTIRDVSLDDTGEWKCVAENSIGSEEINMSLEVHSKPDIVKPEENFFVLQNGEDFSILCHARGLPAPEISWINQETGQVVSNGPILEIENASKHLAGNFLCTAINKAGAAFKEITVTVQSPPKIKRRPTRHEVVTGNSLILNCDIIGGDPEPEIKWYRDEEPLDEMQTDGAFVFLERKQTLKVLIARVEHAGVYKCQASSVAGMDHLGFTVDVWQPPKIHHSDEEVSGISGSSLTLDCDAEGKPEPNIRWERNGEPISSTGVIISPRSLRIPSLDVEEDKGMYSCIAENIAGSKKIDFKVDVWSIPDFEVEQQVLNQTVGQQIEFFCDVDAYPPPKITWLRNNQPISFNPSIQISDSDRRLTLSTTDLNDLGVYNCIAENQAGSSKKSFKLNLMEPPKISKPKASTEKNIVRKIDESLRLVCKIEAGQPQPKVKWYKDGDLVIENLYADGHVLQILNVREHDEGVYRCLAENEAGNDIREWEVSIFREPKITVPTRRELTAVVGESVELGCAADGHPRPIVSWSRNGRAVVEENVDIIDDEETSKLFIDGINSFDKGTWSCTANNAAGLETIDFVIDVWQPPTSKTPSTSTPEPRKETAIEDSSLTLHCDIEAYPMPEISWFHNGEEVEIGGRISTTTFGTVLTIQDSLPTDSGDWQCVAKNPAGSLSASFIVDIWSPPTPLTEMTTQTIPVIGGDTLTLDCPVKGNPKPKLEWLRGSVPISSILDSRYELFKDGETLKVTEVTLFDSTSFKCVAYNDVGMTSMTFGLDVRTVPKIEPNHLNDVVVEGETSVFRCFVSGVPSPAITWFHNGRPLEIKEDSPYKISQQGQMLAISSSVEAHGGDYQCKASNLVGDESAYFRLTVLIPPVISSGSRSEVEAISFISGQQEINGGAALVLSCDPARGSPSPTVTWSKDGRLIEPGESSRHMIIEKSRLLFTTVKSTDAGRYNCKLENEAGMDYRNFVVTVQEPPKVSAPSEKGPEVVESHGVTLSCNAEQDQSEVSFHWTRDGQIVEENERLRFSIRKDKIHLSSTTREDEGVYICHVTNAAGSAQTRVTLTILIPPKLLTSAPISDSSQDSEIIRKFEKDVTTTVSQTLTISCPVSGKPKPSIEWLKFGQRVSTIHKEAILKGESLQIPDVQLKHAGMYICVARNKAGVDQKEISVNIHQQPIVKLPEKEKLFEGRSLSLECDVMGTPTPLIFWQKDGVPLRSQERVYISPDKRRLQIFSTKPEDAGKYKCIAENIIGSEFSETTVQILESPNFEESFKNIDSIEGSRVELSCETNITPKPEIKWMFDGVPITFDSPVFDTFSIQRSDAVSDYSLGFLENFDLKEDGSVLVIATSSVETQGQYKCILSNEAGRASKTFNLQVLRVPVIEDNTEEEVDEEIVVVSGEFIDLECVSIGIPPPKITWFKDSSPVRTIPGLVEISNDGQHLLINEIAQRFSGEYYCMAENEAGSSTKKFNLITNEPPKIRVSDVIVEERSGREVKLFCDVSGIPKPTISWSRTNGKLDHSRMKTSSDGTLTIISAKVQDEGVYICNAENVAGDAQAVVTLSIIEAPVIEGEFNTFVEAVIKNKFLLECNVIGGNPAPVIRWFKDDEPVELSSRLTKMKHGSRLKVKPVIASDAGVYKCFVENDAGSTSRLFNVGVVLKPSIIPDFDMVSFSSIGEEKKFTCLTSGQPTPSITWLHNDRKLSTAADNIVFHNDGQEMIIPHVTLDWSGNVTCVVENQVGVAKMETIFEVFQEPVFTSNVSATIALIAGESLEVPCSATGYPPPVVFWEKDDQVLEMEGGVVGMTTLKLNDVTQDEEGTYTCTASSLAGVNKLDMYLQIHKPPEILEHIFEDMESDYHSGNSLAIGSKDRPIPKEPKEHHRLVLECKSEAFPPPKITWTLNMKPIEFSAKFSLSPNGQVLVIDPVTENDSGLYSCISENIAGFAERFWNVDVFTEPEITNSPVEIVKPLRGEDIDLTCEVTGNPRPDIIWRRNGRLLDLGDKYIETATGIKIKGAGAADSGIYTCEAINRAGKTSTQMTLAVQAKPMIAVGPTKLFTNVNQATLLECVASGIPRPEVRWFKDGEPLDESDVFSLQMSDGSLSIRAATLDDAGDYVCKVENIHGSATRSINLEVHLSPSIKTAFDDTLTLRVGDTLRVPCRAVGYPEPRVSWFLNGVPILPGGEVEIDPVSKDLVVNLAQESHSGEYSCVAENSAGVAKMILDVDVYVPPQFVKNFNTNVELFEHGSAIVTCDASGSPPPSVIWQRSGRLLKGNGSPRQEGAQLIFEDARIRDAGSYVCLAQNSAGTALLEVDVSVLIPPKISIPHRLTATAGSPFTMKPETVRGLPGPTFTWRKDGEKLFSDKYRNVDETIGRLIFVVLEPEDSGRYVIKAENKAGFDEVEVLLTVLEKPKISVIGKDVDRPLEITKGEDFSLMLNLIGSPRPQVTWMRNGVRIGNNARRIVSESGLKITAVDFNDEGDYSISAKNAAGGSFLSFSIIVNSPPRIVMSKRPLVRRQKGKTLELTCEVEGKPEPDVMWLFHGVSISDSKDLTIVDIQPEQAGEYICLATNKIADATSRVLVQVDTLPSIRAHINTTAKAELGEQVTFDCHADGEPQPKYSWTHNGVDLIPSDKYEMTEDGRLTIFDVSAEDSGMIRCTAHNSAGSEHARFELKIELPPVILSPPGSHRVEQGLPISLTCEVGNLDDGKIKWLKDGIELAQGETLTIPNAQLKDTGEYECIAENAIGSDIASGSIVVWRDGEWSDWSRFGPCSVSCGMGSKTRLRMCNNPGPANGGVCPSGLSEETVPCRNIPCPEDGALTEWSEWSECSVSCGFGYVTRQRDCIQPKFNGAPCSGTLLEEKPCLDNPDCLTISSWGLWGAWEACDVTCDGGVQVRSRDCPTGDCRGQSVSSRPCGMGKCPVDGSWGEWMHWSYCSVSCGMGTRTRERSCDSPAPSAGGMLCNGMERQMDMCTTGECPINGNWAEWTEWSVCSHTCGGGYRRKSRTCSDPPPINGGKFCAGHADLSERCSTRPCPVDGNWGMWSEWSSCSVSCGRGFQVRGRTCSNPQPAGDGLDCSGMDSQRKDCHNECDIRTMRDSEGVIRGNINGVDLREIKISSSVKKTDYSSKVQIAYENIPIGIRPSIRWIATVLSPMEFLTAWEEEGAQNGYSLTQGKLQRTSQIEFATGEVLRIACRLTHITRGRHHYTITISGNMPHITNRNAIVFDDAVEEYVQVSQNMLYGSSSRTASLDGIAFPYFVNHTVNYDERYGQMPFLSQILDLSRFSVTFSNDPKSFTYSAEANIYPNEYDVCPEGYELDLVSGRWCNDVNECTQNEACSDGCVNTMGSFLCTCPDGYVIDFNGESCLDVDECTTGEFECGAGLSCANTPGSYKCVLPCQPGTRLSEDESFCDDVDECSEGIHQCDQICINTLGTYKCGCRSGYLAIGEFLCEDMDECLLTGRRKACSDKQTCQNTPGGYHCTNDCPPGFEGENCKDIDECADENLNDCRGDQTCLNTEGGFQCTCKEGFRLVGGKCLDVDECELFDPCPHRCLNTHGSFHCICPPGGCDGFSPDLQAIKVCYDEDNPACPCPEGYQQIMNKCYDINECTADYICQHGCTNLPGGYQCTCPIGYRLAEDGRTCEDINECVEGDIQCGRGRMCFNRLGDYTCIDTPCPVNYHSDPATSQCTRSCRGEGCENRPVSIIEYRTLALPKGIQENEDLLLLKALTEDGRKHPDTRFYILTKQNRMNLPFSIRPENGSGILYTNQALTHPRTYNMRVRATSLSPEGKIEYQSTFIIYISVSAYPYGG